MNTKFDYKQYWEVTYSNNGNSGAGSYGILAEFKAHVVSDFVPDYPNINVIEFGCGDGHQLSLMHYRKYLGLDVSKTAIATCASLFDSDSSKSFLVYDPKHFQGRLRADLVVCLDVLYHITDEEDFVKTLDDIFSCRSPRIALYTRLPDAVPSNVETICDRDIFKYLAKYSERILSMRIVKQKHPELSSADFILLKVKT